MRRLLPFVFIGLVVSCSDTKPKATPTAVEPAKTDVAEPAGPKPPLPKSVDRPDPDETDEERCTRLQKEMAQKAANCSPFNAAACAEMAKFSEVVINAGCGEPTNQQNKPSYKADAHCLNMQIEHSALAAKCKPENNDACKRMAENHKRLEAAGCMSSPLKRPSAGKRRACSVDDDCTIWMYDLRCCSACQPTAVAKEWKRVNELACNGERLEACPKMECKEAPKEGLVPKCQENKCVLAEP